MVIDRAFENKLGVKKKMSEGYFQHYYYKYRAIIIVRQVLVFTSNQLLFVLNIEIIYLLNFFHQQIVDWIWNRKSFTFHMRILKKRIKNKINKEKQ
ncbi:unnamed protein product [Paramecium primaurelia]|uniref:Uncharacterized protein n=1 Tax=Paramecium primaurelia TaxID=5886 RepID=A0A8S1QR45_PARPR|nr:unnamed protein product [Paramecium primaurelia]